MCFDDFNYEMYNEYILIDPNFNQNDLNSELPHGFIPKTVNKVKGQTSGQLSNGDTESIALTTKNLDDLCAEKFIHDPVNVQTEGEKKEEAYQKHL